MQLRYTQLRTFAMRLLVIAGLLSATLLVSHSATARAQTCASDGSYVVSSGSELTDAVNCHNSATTGGTLITFTTAITGPIGFAIENPFGVPLEIDGSGFALSLDPLAGGSPLFVNPPNTGAVTIRNVVLDRGFGDSAVVSHAASALTVIDSEIRRSIGDGVFSTGPLTVEGSTVENNRGNGLFSWISVTVRESMILDNGIEGVNSQGDGTVIGSTIARNGSHPDAANGLGVVGVLTIEDSTIEGNLKQGVFAGSTLTMKRSAVVTNGIGGIYSGGFATIEDSAVLDNGASSPDPRNGVEAMGGILFERSIAASNNGNGLGSPAGITVRASIIASNKSGPAFVNAGVGAAQSIIVENSTILDNEVGLSAGDSIMVTNSTVVENERDGIGCNCTVTVVSSTVVDNDQAGLGTFAVAGDGAPSTVTSSIVDTCVNVSDGGNNVGGCFGTAPTTMLATADNGCLVRAGSPSEKFCGPTRALPNGSNALGAGSCVGSVDFDQRTQPRPLDTACDAGAYEAPPIIFDDVPPGAFFAGPVAWAAAAGITTGTSPTLFSPDATLTRAQMATFLWRFAGEPAPAGANPFSDVPPTKFYADAVTWLAETGVTTGTSPTTFSPDAKLTRGQMATFLWRFAGEPATVAPNPFSDVPVGKFYATAVIWMAESSITTGTTATTFSPDASLTRGQAVTFLFRFGD